MTIGQKNDRKLIVNLKNKSIKIEIYSFFINIMATKTTSKKDNKDWMKSVLVTGLFVIAFVCAFFWMNVEKNTPLQFVDKMLSWDIVENASKTAKNVKEIVTPLQGLLGWTSGLSLDISNLNDLSSITENLDKLNDLKESYNELKDNDMLKSVLGIEDDKEAKKAEKLVSTESDFIDSSIDFFSFLKDNQDEISYDEDGSLEIDDSIKWVFEDLLKSRTDSKLNVEKAESNLK